MDIGTYTAKYRDWYHSDHTSSKRRHKRCRGDIRPMDIFLLLENYLQTRRKLLIYRLIHDRAFSFQQNNGTKRGKLIVIQPVFRPTPTSLQRNLSLTTSSRFPEFNLFCRSMKSDDRCILAGPHITQPGLEMAFWSWHWAINQRSIT